MKGIFQCKLNIIKRNPALASYTSGFLSMNPRMNRINKIFRHSNA